MSISKGLTEVLDASSWIRRMFEEGERLRAERGAENVFDFSLGNPILEPPARFREELRRLANDPAPGMHRYMPNAGYPETRAAIATYYARETGLSFAADDVLMTCGAAGGLNVVFKTILDPGDEVVVLSPYFVEYRFYVTNHGGRTVTVPTGPRFQLDAGRIAEAIGNRTKAVLVNSPNNPTGVVYPRADLAELGRVLVDASRRIGHPIFLVSDEPYRRIAYDGIEVPYLFDLYPDTILVTSHSKDLGLAGERIGMILASPRIPDRKTLVTGMIFANRTLGYVNAPALMQRIVARLQGESIDVAAYQAKRDRLLGALIEAGYDVVKPGGAFYLFPRSPIEDDVRFVRLLVEEGILVVPGRGFGTPGYFRISYAVADDVIERAIPGFRRGIERAK
ncbi:MAG: pyridoxal phosphate-dependent aminotransferase [Planctomycetes bacterium]|nr:pyridoxal phosphate-dependent aminotransferase [Planctomycetota bacterium]